MDRSAAAVDPRALARRRIERAEIIARISGGVAHNFNNVLAVILGRVELMLNLAELGRLEPAQVRKGLLSVRDAALDAGELLKRLRELTQPPQEVTFSVFDVNTAIVDAVGLLQPHVATVSQAQGIPLRLTHCLTRAPALISGQPSALREVVVNLILNAIEAMPAGGIITIETSVEGPWIALRISDTGVGMSEDVRAQAFTPFFTTKGPGNTGLGLSSARDLVTVHGGAIAVASEPGHGTAVTITLPSATAPPSPLVVAPAAPIPPGLRVLVVEDEPALAQVLTEFLSGKECRVSVAYGGLSALAQLEQEQYDVVITDLLLPEATGWEIGRAAKRRSDRCAVILISGELMVREGVPLGGAAVDEVLPKPLDLSRLVRTIGLLADRPRTASRPEGA